MQEPQRLLSRLNAITIDWRNCRSTGEVLKAEEIAACLSGLARGPYLLLLHLWCQDQTVEVELWELLLNEFMTSPCAYNWQSKNNLSRLGFLIKMALIDLQIENLCETCKGTGIVTNQTCMKCNGKGRKRRTQAEYARRCKVKASNWQKIWADKYQEVYLKILEWNEIGISHLLSRLGTA